MDVIWQISMGELLIIIITVPTVLLLNAALWMRISDSHFRIVTLEGTLTTVRHDVATLTRALAITDASIAAHHPIGPLDE